MTAHRNTDRPGLKAGRSPVDAETFLAFVQDRDQTTLEELAARFELPECEVRKRLMYLQEHDLVTVDRGLYAVFVEATEAADRRSDYDDDQPVPDGGPLTQLVHALTDSRETIDLTEREFYDCVSNPRRRQVLRYLAVFYDEDQQRGVYVDVSTVVDAFLDRLSDEAKGPARDDGDRQSYYVALTQVHAPRLDEAGLVDHYERVQKVRITDDGLAVVSLMTEISDLCATDSHTDEGQV